MCDSLLCVNAGLMITTLVSYLSHSQIWALQEQSLLHIGGRTNRATLAFAGELSRILDAVPDRGSGNTASVTGQVAIDTGISTVGQAPLFLSSDGSQKVQQLNPGAGANRNSEYVPDDTVGNVNGSSIGFASIDDD